MSLIFKKQESQIIQNPCIDMYIDKLTPYLKKEKIQYWQQELERLRHIGWCNPAINDADVSKDISEIKYNIIRYHIKKPCLKHCCDPYGNEGDGAGYWALWEQDSSDRHYYFPSEVKLGYSNTCSSETSIICFYLFEHWLCDTLVKIKQACNVNMEIKHLYYPYIYHCCEDLKDDDTFFRFFDACKFLEDNKDSADIFSRKSNISTCDYYNGEDSIYYVVNKNIAKCIGEIYQQREILEKNGLWNDADKAIDELIHVKNRNQRKNQKKNKCTKALYY